MDGLHWLCVTGAILAFFGAFFGLSAIAITAGNVAGGRGLK
jgi:hypothetical protein